MIKITDSGYGLKADFGNGTILSYPYCSTLILLEGKSDSVTVKHMGDASLIPMFTAVLGDLIIGKKIATRDNVISLYDEISNSKCGQGGGECDTTKIEQMIKELKEYEEINDIHSMVDEINNEELDCE